MTHTKTIKELAQEMLDNMETKTRDNGESFVCLKNHDIQWQVDVCREAHPSSIMPNDYVYEEIQNSLEYIVDANGETMEEIQEEVIDSNCIEPEIYNSNLLAWVSNNLYFAEYVDEAINDYEPKTLFEALSYGNQRFKEEVFQSVLNSLNKQAE